MADDPRTLECDLIMKGGVTSGLVYPGAIVRIAQDYRIRAIGGTSAGALAAAAAAAMEYGIRTGGHSLEQALALMAALPAEAGQQTDSATSLLEALFTADGDFRRPFALAKRLLGANPPRGLTLLGAIWAAAPPGLLSRPLLWAGAGLAAAIALGLLLAGPLGAPNWVALLACALLGLLLPAIALWRGLGQALARLAGAWHDQGWGMASGMAKPDERMKGEEIPALTAWMHATFQRLAGPKATAPLSFGDLWKAGRQPGDTARAIDLALVSTDLNRMQSVQFPYLPDNERLLFDPDVWAQLFPEDVMAALEKASVCPASHDPTAFRRRFGYPVSAVQQAASPALFARLRVLPVGEDLPIIVAARASMAFPGLFTPVPLWLLRWVGSGNQRVPELGPVLLSDGGITSNFPIHLFDAPVPSRPTFAINLVYPDDQITGEPRGEGDGTRAPLKVEQISGGGNGGTPDMLRDLFMPSSNAGRVQLYKAPPHGSPIVRAGGFAMRVVEAARTWADVSLYGQPGMRDRIIHVRLSDSEGGFNLGMDHETITRLAAKGSMAGDVLARRFDPVRPEDPLNPGLKLRLNWHNHRFVRLRSFLAAQELIGHRLAHSWPHVNDAQRPQSLPPLSSILATARRSITVDGHEMLIGYTTSLTLAQRRHMQGLVNDVMALRADGGTASALKGAPRPASVMRLRPTSADPKDSQP